jgi:hypothetical protein
MKGRKARTGRLNRSGGVYNTWKSNAANITIVGNTAAILIQEKSRREGAEEWEWPVPGTACP